MNNEILGNCAIQLAANYSGRAINITRTTAPHALSYILTSNYKIPHGCAVAFLFCECWKKLIDRDSIVTHPFGRDGLDIILCDISKLLGGDDIDSGLTIFSDLLKEIKLERPSVCIKNINILIDEVNIDRLNNFPIILSKEDIREIYTKSLDIIYDFCELQ